MKHNILKRSIAGLIAVSMLLPVGACGTEKEKAEKTKPVVEKMDEEKVYSYAIDAIGGNDVMPIAGFYGPYELGHSYMGVSVPNYISDDIFSKLSDCGINLIQQSNLDAKEEPEGQVRMLELADKYGIGVYVRHSDIYGLHRDNLASLEEMSEIINLYANYPAFAGVDVIDEPGTEYWWNTLPQGYISDYVETVERLKKLDIGFGVNAITAGPAAEEMFTKYLTEFCSTLKPQYLCHTNYTFHDAPDGTNDDDLHKDMSTALWKLDKIRSYAEEYNIPFWRYVAAGGQMNDDGTAYDSKSYYPNEGQTLWEVNTSLAYGVKGIAWFTLIEPLHFSYAKSEPYYDSERCGLIGVWGNKTQFWYYAQKANEQIEAVDHVLMNAVNKGVLVYGKNAKADTSGNEAVISGDSWRELRDVDGSAMVGCFNYKGKSAFYVVNYEFQYRQKITLDLLDAYNLTVIQQAETSRVKTDSLTLDMEPGEGVLIVVD